MTDVGTSSATIWIGRLVVTLGTALAVSCSGSSQDAHADGPMVAQTGGVTKNPVAAPQAELADHFLSCFRTVPSRDVESDVRREAALGERRFFYVGGWEGMSWHPLGIASCSRPAGRPDERRQLAVAGYALPPSGSTQVGDACAIAILNYAGEYNQAMAKLFPASLRRNCPSGHGRIDGSYRPDDLVKLARRLHLN